MDTEEGQLSAYASGSGSLSFVIRDEDRKPVSGRRPQADECIALIKGKCAEGHGIWGGGHNWMIVNQGPLDRENHERFEAVQKVQRLAPNMLQFRGNIYHYNPEQDHGLAGPIFVTYVAGQEIKVEGTGNHGALGYFLKNEKILANPARVVWDSKEEKEKATEKVMDAVATKQKTFGYYIDLDERGSFSADVRNTDGKTIFEVKAGNELGEDESSIFDDGFMKNKTDLDGLSKHLKSLGLIQQDGELLAMQEFEQRIEEIDAYLDTASVTPSYGAGQRFNFKAGEQIVGNGYRGTVVKVCDGQLKGMVEIRLPGGVGCVSASFPDCYPATYNGAEIVTEGRHVGTVEEVTEQFVAQNVGRGKQVLHETHRFGSYPAVGDKIDVQYEFGKAVVGVAKDKGNSNER